MKWRVKSLTRHPEIQKSRGWRFGVGGGEGVGHTAVPYYDVVGATVLQRPIEDLRRKSLLVLQGQQWTHSYDTSRTGVTLLFRMQIGRTSWSGMH